MAEEVSTKDMVGGCGCLIVLLLAGIAYRFLAPQLGMLIIVAGAVLFGIIASFVVIMTSQDKEKRIGAGCICFCVFIVAALIALLRYPQALSAIGIAFGVFLCALWVAQVRIANQKQKDKEITDKFEAALLASADDLGLDLDDMEITTNVNVPLENEMAARRRLTVEESVEQLIQELAAHRFAKINRFIANYIAKKTKAVKIFETILRRAQHKDADCMFILALVYLKQESGEESGKWLKRAISSEHGEAVQFWYSLHERYNNPETAQSLRDTIDVAIKIVEA